MSKRRKLFITTAIIFVVAIIYTLLVMKYDVSAIGPKNTKVGFAGINHAFHSLFPYNETWYKITKYLGIIPFLICAFYGLQGIMQIFKTKSIKKVDKRLIYLGLLYVAMLVVYIIFDKVVINYRPVLEDGILEASYPSSHTLLGICICASSLFISKFYIRNKSVLKVFNALTYVLMIVLVIGRAISGVHWLTDILGGIIFGTFLVSLYYSCICNYKKTRN